jgi:signal transduction histidine kinase
MSTTTDSLESLLAVAIATLDERGTLIEANAGFLRLTNLADTSPAGARVDRLFIQPDFATLQRGQPDADGKVYQGLLTLGEYTGQTRTLRARIWREGSLLRLLAEYDIEDLERLNTTVLDLNRDYAQAQIELALLNFKLQATNVQLKETQKKLVEAEKMASLGILVAGVAHEINTPLGVGLLAAGTLHDQSGDLAKQFAGRSMTQSDLTQFLDMAGISTDLIRQNLERIGRLIDTFRQVAVQGKSLEKHTIRVRECLDEVIRSLGDRLPAERILVQIGCAAELEIESDVDDWASIFTNLIGNSLQHGFKGRERGVIDISIERAANKLRIDYRDDGVGMTPEVLSRVFDPFFTTDLQAGMGLGMHLVYNLITHRLGGSIRCESQPGSGVCFHIELPL